MDTARSGFYGSTNAPSITLTICGRLSLIQIMASRNWDVRLGAQPAERIALHCSRVAWGVTALLGAYAASNKALSCARSKLMRAGSFIVGRMSIHTKSAV